MHGATMKIIKNSFRARLLSWYHE